MKQFLSIAIIVLTPALLGSCKSGQAKRADENAGISFYDTLVDFGVIPFSGDGDCEFVFVNTGTEPLLLTHVKSTCGCTIPAWSKEPVNPSDTGKIEVSYDTHRIGRFSKSIYVYSNALNGTQRLYIRGEVEGAEDPETQ